MDGRGAALAEVGLTIPAAPEDLAGLRPPALRRYGETDDRGEEL